MAGNQTGHLRDRGAGLLRRVTMKFSEAKARLKELAKGRHHHVAFELDEYSSGKEETGCTLYINGLGSASGSTWEEAFAKLENRLGKGKVEEYPDIEPKQAVGR